LLGETGRQLFNALQNLKAKGLTKKIGISIYDPGELEALMSEMDFDLVQAPLNILDRRLVASGWASRLKTRGVELHVRSAFLQGLLLMPTDQRPAKFSRWQPVWEEWSRWQLETGLTPMQACLGYVLGVEEIDKVVVGVDSAMQLKEILDSVHSVLPNLPDWPMPIEPILINPSRWSQL
jgi:aryl-alcohol dehydrogenase-like predicted oxidoreductase